jgi:nicotinate-nucleotide adenylyltransferase
MKNIALFGGSFDPPHLGHITIVDKALEKLDIEKVVIVPAYLNPFKSKSHASAPLRLKWLKQIFAGRKNVEISDFEITQNRAVATIETVNHFSRNDQKIYLIIGADNLKSLHKWFRFDELDKIVTWAVASRNGIEIPPEFITLDVAKPVSSTQLRNRQKHHELPPSVAKEIAQFYKETNAHKN